MEEFEYSGLWWLPEEPDRRISGILKFHPTEGASLELFGSFIEFKEFIDRKTDPRIILGITADKDITLFKCIQTSQSTSPKPEFSKSFFRVEIVFVGHHFKNEEDIVFDSIILSYPHLEEWIGISGFQPKYCCDPEKHFRKCDISHSLPEEVEIEVDDLSISIDCRFSHSSVLEEISLKQTAFIVAKPREQKHFDDYRSDICYHVQNFLSLAIGTPVYPLIMKGNTKACMVELPDGRSFCSDISIFYSVREPPGPSGKILSHEMLFSFVDIAEDFEKCLGNWFRKSEILRPVYDLYFGTLYAPSPYLEHEFLCIIQAMESYHRRISGKNLSLRRRLEETRQKYADVMDRLIDDHNQFIDDLINTRNYLTHYDKKKRPKAKRGRELYVLTQKLRSMLQACLLAELGLSMETIKTLIPRSRHYRLSLELSEKAESGK